MSIAGTVGVAYNLAARCERFIHHVGLGSPVAVQVG